MHADMCMHIQAYKCVRTGVVGSVDGMGWGTCPSKGVSPGPDPVPIGDGIGVIVADKM